MTTLNMIVLEKVDSTNNYAMALIKKGSISNEMGVFAMEQTNGKGRRGKQWNARPGQNVTLSVVAEMKWQPVLSQFPLSVAVALACRDFIASFVKEKVFIKWPNDIFINDSKAAGVQIENVIKGTLWQWTVIGIGVNVNQVDFDNVDAKVTSLKRETGGIYDVLTLAGKLKDFVLTKMEDLKKGNFDQMLQEYNEHLYGRNCLIKLKKESVVFETTIRAVSESGQLITWDVLERRFNFDEVSLRGLI